MSSAIRITRPAAHIAVVEIDNPPTTALGDAIRGTLLDELAALNADLSVRAVVLTGAGRAFCSGDDLREVATRGPAMAESLAQFARLFDLIEGFRAPVIAAINGHAMGGGLELALCCDIRIAATHAKFAAAGVNVGLMASVYRLPRLIGIARAKAMLLTGSPIDAETALHYGLVTELHDPVALMDAAVALAARIASRAPLSIEASKRQAARAYDLDPAAAQASSSAEMPALTASADHKAAVQAFLAKREPVFTRS
jgi:enoyl-CoA hydratase/carnithine racemase